MNKLKILIVDDDQVDCKNYQRMLSAYLSYPHELFSVATAKAAQEWFDQEGLPDCILIDYQLPDSDGLSFIKEINERFSAPPPIVMLTGQGSEEIAVEVMKSGAVDYLVKDRLQSYDLVRAVTSAVEQRKLSRIIEKQQEKLAYYATYDALTGLLNRHSFEEQVVNVLSEKSETQKFAMLYIDLDNFKTINDTLGHHPVGDELLEKVGQRIQGALGKHDLVARFGGDEFTAFLVGVEDKKTVAGIAKKLVDTISQRYQIDANEVYAGASIGVAMFPESGETFSELLKNADIALYLAKSLGRGNYQFFSDDTNRMQERRLTVERALHSALEKQQFSLVFEPKFRLKDKKLIGVETLLRWDHDVLGSIMPDNFISIAENTGLIVPIGHWVMQEAIRHCSKWLNEGLCDESLSIAVNISSHQLLQGDLVNRVGDLLKETRLPMSMLELEVTETAIMRAGDDNTKILNQLSEMPIRLVIDDFGTGYSSLARIKFLPVKAIKIDQAFVTGLPDDKNDAAIVKTIIQLSNELSLGVIAEGIESKQQMQHLQKAGCDYGQGRYFGDVMTADEMDVFLKAQQIK